MGTQTRVFINYLKQNDDRAATELLYAKDELDRVERGPLNEQDKVILKEIKGLIDGIKSGNKRSAFTRAQSFPVEYTKRFEELLRAQNTNKRSNQDLSGSLRGRRNDTNATNQPGETSQQQSPSTFPVAQNKVVVENVNQQADLEYRSKMAGQAMRYNNPDIADLSDINRPTKVAERFSELYDNEWTEAFEALTKVKPANLTDRDVIDLLLKIVEKAYNFCSFEANKQIHDMRSSILKVMGSDSKPARQPEGDVLLVQYRKSIAALAVDRLIQEFKETELNKLFATKHMDPPKDGRPVDVYTMKAVELTWWMCVQDPPIHMCLSADRPSDSECPALYRAYTRSGRIPDYFVWPALKLHKKGGVLMKGVMQFK